MGREEIEEGSAQHIGFFPVQPLQGVIAYHGDREVLICHHQDGRNKAVEEGKSLFAGKEYLFVALLLGDVQEAGRQGQGALPIVEHPGAYQKLLPVPLEGDRLQMADPESVVHDVINHLLGFPGVPPETPAVFSDHRFRGIALPDGTEAPVYIGKKTLQVPHRNPLLGGIDNEMIDKMHCFILPGCLGHADPPDCFSKI